MNKQTLTEYISGVADDQTSKLVERWLLQSEENMIHFSKVKDEYIYSTMPDMCASDSQMKIAEKIIRKSGREKKMGNLQYATIFAAAVLVVAIICNLTLFYLNQRDPDNHTEIAGTIINVDDDPSSYLHTIYTDKGTKGEVVLPDSSIVRLNSDTKITFPDKFLGSTRDVYLSGEAFFKVKGNPDTPMVVNTNKGISIQVMGTKFNVRTYDNEPLSRTTLYSGKVEILKILPTGDVRKVAELKPNESYITRFEKPALKVLKADTLKAGAWSKGVLLFDNTPMDMVIKELERWYGASITVKNDNIYGFSFTATFRSQSLIQVLESIKFCANVNYTIDGNEVVFY